MTINCPIHGPYETISIHVIEACPQCIEEGKKDQIQNCPKLFTGGVCDKTCIICTGDVKIPNPFVSEFKPK